MSKTFAPEQAYLYGSKNIFVRYAIKSRSDALAERVDSKDIILDAGCGEGYISIILAKTVKKLIGIDVNKGFIKKAANKAKEAKLSNTRFLVANIGTFSSKTEFDKIICSEVMEHVENPVALLENFKKLLKRSGKIIITIPNEKMLELARRIVFPTKWKIIKKNTYHKIELNSKLISEMGHKIGLKTVEVKKLPWPFLYINELVVLEHK